MGVRARSETTSKRVCNMTEVGIEIAENGIFDSAEELGLLDETD